MSYEQQINEALARAYCTPENSSKELDATLINTMTQEIIKSFGFGSTDRSRPIEQQVRREVGGQCETELRDGNKILKEFAEVINRNCLENDSNTPDFILAQYVNNCLQNFTIASRSREKWYGKELHI